MSRARPAKLFRPTPSVGKPTAKRSVGASPVPSPVAKEAQEPQVDADLTRALKQIFEVRNGKLNRPEDSVTLFGKKLSTPSQDGGDSSTKNAGVPFSPLSRQGSDKLPAAATAHLLKELHKQRLKQRGITAAVADIPDMGEIEFVHERKAEVSTLPLLNSLQEKRPASHDNLPESRPDGAELKRQRLDKDQAVDLSLSIRCPLVFGSPNAASASQEDAEEMEILDGDKRSEPSAEQLTLFYNGSVFVYDDIPSDKAKAIMVLASSISSKASCYARTPSAPETSSLPSVKSDLSSIYASPKKAVSEKRSTSDVPQARKASLQRFLEKRKDRLYPKVTQPEKGGSRSRSPTKERSSSRSPSPTSRRKHSSPTTQPRTPCRSGGSDDQQQQQQQLESCAGPCGEAEMCTTPARQWIGV